MKYYLGIDGGGTKTTAVICDENKNICASFHGEGLNYNVIGMETARRHLQETLSGNPFPVHAAFLGLAALSGPADAAKTQELCENIIPCDLIGMDSDVAIALEAMDCTGPVAVAIAGTGSMAAGRLPDGKKIHTGGWGPLLGDEGSGYRLALQGVKAALRAAEGSGDRTILKDAVFTHFGVRSADDLIGLFYAAPLSSAKIAAFAPQIFRCAGAGDPAAKEILQSEARAFGVTVSALLRQLPAGTPLGLWGGIFQHYPDYRNDFTKIIRRAFPETEAVLLPHPPEYGAVLAAMQLNHEDLS